MPFAMLIIGLIIIVAGARGNSEALLTLVDEDFLSKQGYIPWAISVLAVGAVGYVPKAKPISDAFLVLILVVLILSNKNVFQNIQTAVSNIGGQTLAGSTSTPKSVSTSTTSTASSATPGTASSSNSYSSLFSSILKQVGSSSAQSSSPSTGSASQ